MRSRVRTYILEDDATVRSQLISFVGRIPELELAGVSASPLEAGSMMHRSPPDLLVLDIGLPFLNGYQFLALLQKRPKVIVVSSDAGHAVEAFTNGATDFLLKPFGFDRFVKAVSRAIGRQLSNTLTMATGAASEALTLKSGKRTLQILRSQIQLVQGMGNYVKLHLEDGSVLVNETMARMEKMLAEQGFVRVHRSYIIALSAVSSFNARTVEWRGREIPVGSIYRRHAIESINSYLPASKP